MGQSFALRNVAPIYFWVPSVTLLFTYLFIYLLIYISSGYITWFTFKLFIMAVAFNVSFVSIDFNGISTSQVPF